MMFDILRPMLLLAGLALGSGIVSAAEPQPEPEAGPAESVQPKAVRSSAGPTAADQALTQQEGSPALRPNMVFLLVDDLGSYDVGWRGSEIKTPQLDKLAKAGVRLEQFYVQPVCSPTRAAFLTGRYPFRIGFQESVVRPWADYGLPLEERTLANALHDVGYETAIVGKWHLGHCATEYLPTHRGFDHQYGHYNGALDYFTHLRDGGYDWFRDDKPCYDAGYSTKLLGREASRRIRERDTSRPLFLYVPFQAVHGPIQAPGAYVDQYPNLEGNRQVYAGMVTAVDDAVGEIVEALQSEGMTDNTLIMFASDNGGPNPGKLTSNGPLRAGKGTVYEGGVRTCAFATWPGQIQPGTQTDALMHIADWYPTLLKLAGGTLKEAQQPGGARALDGQDLWPAISAGASSPRSEIVMNVAPSSGAIRQGNWKLVVGGRNRDLDDGTAPPIDVNSPAGKRRRQQAGEMELFQLSDDVSEKNNVASAHPEIVQRLRTRYDELASQAVPPKSEPKPKDFQAPALWGPAGAGTKAAEKPGNGPRRRGSPAS